MGGGCRGGDCRSVYVYVCVCMYSWGMRSVGVLEGNRNSVAEILEKKMLCVVLECVAYRCVLDFFLNLVCNFLLQLMLQKHVHLL